MDTALKLFFQTGRELDRINSQANNVRISNIELLVNEFRETLVNRAVAAEAIDAYDQPVIQQAISDMAALKGDRPKATLSESTVRN